MLNKSPVLVGEYYIKKLARELGIGDYYAKTALERREGIYDFAVEYVQNDELDLPFAEKYPEFHKFVTSRRDYVGTH